MLFNKEDIDIGERLRTIRENMHMTREQFSEKIDITNTIVWKRGVILWRKKVL